MQVTGAWLAAAVGGRLTSGDAGAVIGRVETDSRRVGPGDLFVALRGPRFDGRAFAGEALARGAMGVMVGGGPWTAPAPAGGVVPVVIEVSDAIEALQRFAAAVRRAVSTTVVAITGSAGKTTTKETIAALLSGSFRVVKNEGNLNNHIGLPLSLLRLREAPDVAVMELGMNHAGEISALVAIADPDVRVWTNVGDAHLGFFSSSDALADAKAEIGRAHV